MSGARLGVPNSLPLCTHFTEQLHDRIIALEREVHVA